MIAGIIMNVFLAWIIFVGLYIANPKEAIIPQAIVESVLPGTPAEVSGVLPQDKIVEIVLQDGKSYLIEDYYDLASVLSTTGDELTLIIQRSSEIVEIKVKPQFDENNGRYFIGIKNIEPIYRDLNFLQCIERGTVLLGLYSKEMVSMIVNLFKGVGLENLSGPVGIIQVTGQQAKEGILSVMYLVAVLSLNVAFFNLVPLPILDGGRVLLIIIEAMINKPINKRIEIALMVFSLAMVLLLMLFASYNDILRLFK